MCFFRSYIPDSVTLHTRVCVCGGGRIRKGRISQLPDVGVNFSVLPSTFSRIFVSLSNRQRQSCFHLIWSLNESFPSRFGAEQSISWDISSPATMSVEAKGASASAAAKRKQFSRNKKKNWKRFLNTKEV